MAEIKVHEDLALKQKRPGFKKPIFEAKSGFDFWRKAQRWMRRTRSIDRLNDRYHEHISDPDTGEVVRSIDEPLSEHQGRGSAKKHS